MAAKDNFLALAKDPIGIPNIPPKEEHAILIWVLIIE